MTDLRRTLTFSVLSFAFGASAANAAEWKTHTFPDKHFAIEFSGEVGSEPVRVDAATRAKLEHSTGYFQDGGTYAYIVTASLFKMEPDVDLGVKGAMRRYKCDKTESDVAISGLGDAAREVHASSCVEDAIIGSRFVRAGNWFYQITYLVSDPKDVTDADHFLKSFVIVK